MNETVKESESISPARQDDQWSLRDIALAIAAFVVIIALAVVGFLYYQSTKPPMVTEGVPAPDFTYPVFNSDTSATLSSNRGKVVLVNVWNTTCLECKKEMPLMERKYRALKDKPFEILAVATDAGGASKIGPFVDALVADKFDAKGNLVVEPNGTTVQDRVNLTFPILMDTENEVGSTYQTVLYPESFIVDRDGTVARIVIGRLTNDDFAYIECLIDPASPGCNPHTSQGAQ